MGHIVSVVSGKGGAGKSTVAAGLGRCLAAQGQRVLLVDTDWSLCAGEFLIDGGATAVYNMQDVLAGVVTLAQALVQGNKETPDFLAAGLVRSQVPDPKAVAQLLLSIVSQYDWMIVDRPAGLDFALEQVLPDFMGLVVSQTDSVSIRGAGLAYQGLQAAGASCVYTVLNRFLPAMMKKHLIPDVDTLCDQIGAPLLGIIPEDAAVLEALLTGKTDMTQAYGKALTRISRRLQGESIPLPKLTKLQR